MNNVHNSTPVTHQLHDMCSHSVTCLDEYNINSNWLLESNLRIYPFTYGLYMTAILKYLLFTVEFPKYLNYLTSVESISYLTDLKVSLQLPFGIILERVDD